jgi:hypothetical protein
MSKTMPIKKATTKNLDEKYKNADFRCMCCQQLAPNKRAFEMFFDGRSRISVSVCQKCAEFAKKAKITTVNKLSKKIFGNVEIYLLKT